MKCPTAISTGLSQAQGSYRIEELGPSPSCRTEIRKGQRRVGRRWHSDSAIRAVREPCWWGHRRGVVGFYRGVDETLVRTGLEYKANGLR